MGPVLLRLPLALAGLVLGGCLPCAGTGDLCLVAEELPEALLFVRAPAVDDVWVVGTEATPGTSGPTAGWYDGSAWTWLDLTDHVDRELWSVHVGDERVTLVGTGGLILEHDRASGATVRVDGPDPAVTFFGVWGADDDDVWAVGGVIGGDAPPSIWRRQGADWARYVDPTLGEGPDGSTYFKVDGRAASDLWIVGDRGTALHWNGTALTATPTDADVDTSTAPLLTVDVQGPTPVAVGGAGSALLLEWDGAAWRDASPAFTPPLNGVCSNGSTSWAVGAQGAVVGSGSGWTDALEAETFLDYHSCAVDPDGGLWAVGGQITGRPLDEGILAYRGPGGVERLR